MPKESCRFRGHPRHLRKHGYTISAIDKGPDILVINTCSFIKPARDESVDSILEGVRLKKEGKVKRLMICGCLSQMYGKKTLDELPEADAVFVRRYSRDRTYLESIERSRRTAVISKRPAYLYDDRSPRVTLTPRHYAYVKVSEGCDNSCSYCVISRLRGRLRSRTMGSVLKEVMKISASGALKEICITGQDTTVFGKDNYGRPMLADLVDKMAALKMGVEWIRILYTHPAHYTDKLIDVVRDREKVCKYLDIPIQHISDRLLKNMNRRTRKSDIIALSKNCASASRVLPSGHPYDGRRAVSLGITKCPSRSTYRA